MATKMKYILILLIILGLTISSALIYHEITVLQDYAQYCKSKGGTVTKTRYQVICTSPSSP